MNELTGSKGCLATATRSLREIAPLLENYFGITLGYFENEIELSTGKHAAKAIQRITRYICLLTVSIMTLIWNCSEKRPF